MPATSRFWTSGYMAFIQDVEDIFLLSAAESIPNPSSVSLDGCSFLYIC